VAYTPVKAAETCIEFDSSSVHRVTVNDEFLQYLEEVREIVDKFNAVSKWIGFTQPWMWTKISSVKSSILLNAKYVSDNKYY
jgi:hypothetical protein